MRGVPGSCPGELAASLASKNGVRWHGILSNQKGGWPGPLSQNSILAEQNGVLAKQNCVPARQNYVLGPRRPELCPGQPEWRPGRPERRPSQPEWFMAGKSGCLVRQNKVPAVQSSGLASQNDVLNSQERPG